MHIVSFTEKNCILLEGGICILLQNTQEIYQNFEQDKRQNKAGSHDDEKHVVSQKSCQSNWKYSWIR